MTYEQCEREARRHLTDKRFYHSQCVAAEAARLAQRYGADVARRENRYWKAQAPTASADRAATRWNSARCPRN